MLLYSYAPISGEKAPLSHHLDRYLTSAAPKNHAQRHAALTLMSALAARANMSADAPVKTDALGRPFFDAPDAPFFGLSHSGGLAAAAIGDTQVGIDVQVHDKRLSVQKLAARWFSEEEQQALADAEYAADTFFELWTKKEALGKYLGVGLAPLVKKDTLALAREHGVSFETTAFDFGGERYTLTVCSKERPTLVFKS